MTELTGRSFFLHGTENSKAGEFMAEHKLKHKPCTVAAGGRFTFSFTLTDIGTVQVVSCACGEKLDVTDYDSW